MTGPANTLLSSLEPSLGVLEPTFDPMVTSYTLSLGLRAPELAFTPTTAATEGANVVVGGAPTNSGESSSAQPLSFGNQAVEIVVTNLEGESTTYSVDVNRGDAMEHTAYVKASNPDADDRFASGVFGSTRVLAISNGTLVVGAPGEASNATIVNGNESNNAAPGAGAAYVFIRGEDGGWTQQAYLKPLTIDADDGFGRAVAIDGDTIVVGAPGEDSSSATGANNVADDAGAAFVFVRNGDVWSQQAYLKASNREAGDSFGTSVSISGDSVAIGATGEDSSGVGVNSGSGGLNNATNAGAAYVFTRSGSSWTEQAYVKSSLSVLTDRFGSSLAILGDRLVVGASGQKSASVGINGNQASDGLTEAGAAYVFERSGTLWTQTTFIKASNTDSIHNFGLSVALSDDLVVVGAPLELSRGTGVNGNQFDNAAGEHVGAAYVFRETATSWEQEAYLKPNFVGVPGAQFYFGSQLALVGNLLAVSGPRDSSASIGVNANDADSGATASGAIYLFRRDDDGWKTAGYIKPTNTDPNDNAGSDGLALDDSGTLVFGSSDDSSAVGINGDATDNSLMDSGALFIVE